MEYMNILRPFSVSPVNKLLRKVEFAIYFSKLSIFGWCLSSWGMVNSGGRGHFRSLPRNVLGILGFGAVFGPWVGQRGVGGGCRSIPVQLL